VEDNNCTRTESHQNDKKINEINTIFKKDSEHVQYRICYKKDNKDILYYKKENSGNANITADGYNEYYGNIWYHPNLSNHNTIKEKNNGVNNFGCVAKNSKEELKHAPKKKKIINHIEIICI